MVRVESEIRLDYKDVLIRPKRSTLNSRKQVSLIRSFTFRNSGQTWSGVPVTVANMDTTGTFEMALALSKHKVLTCIHKHYKIAEWEYFAKSQPAVLPYVAVSAGTSAEDIEMLDKILSKASDVPFICLDVANGYSERFVQTVKDVRKKFPTKTIIAGNVVTGEMVEELILSGADIVKVGIGPGSVCTTRKQTGVGYPQLSAVIECSDAAHGLKGMIIADGGCTCPGDFAKAFGAGADFVMSGGMFAGHDESSGELVTRNGKKFKLFYGMSSTTAMQKHHGQVAEYRSSEGKTVEVPYKGSVEPMIMDLLGGLRSACTYIGAITIKEMSKRTTFIRCTQQLNQIFSVHKDTSEISYAKKS